MPSARAARGRRSGDRRRGRAAYDLPVRVSRFWTLVEDEFGAAYAHSLSRSHVMSALGGRTAVEALEAGIPPRDVWLALCADMDVPEERRHGRDVPKSR
jgi:hypothetical protein